MYFTNGTTGKDSTIKVRGASKFGLDNVDLGVGSVPQIYNLKQATNSEGLNLFVDANGNKVTTPPANLVDGYFPLYIDEGELTFDKSGVLSALNKVFITRNKKQVLVSIWILISPNQLSLHNHFCFNC